MKATSQLLILFVHLLLGQKDNRLSYYPKSFSILQTLSAQCFLLSHSFISLQVNYCEHSFLYTNGFILKAHFYCALAELLLNLFSSPKGILQNSMLAFFLLQLPVHKGMSSNEAFEALKGFCCAGCWLWLFCFFLLLMLLGKTERQS